MKTLVYLLLMMLTAAISDATEETPQKDAQSTKCSKSVTTCDPEAITCTALKPDLKKRHPVMGISCEMS